MTFDIIVAHDKSLGIGKNNDLLCYLPEDMKFFKQLTTKTQSSKKQNIVILGRKTYDSIPKQFKPLSNRHNIVISRSVPNTNSYLHAESPEKAMAQAIDLVKRNKAETIYCIGGSSIYTHFITHPECRFLYVTLIHSIFNADSFFPDYHTLFKKIDSKKIISNTNNIPLEFIKYQRITSTN